MIGRNVEALAKSLEERRALEGELDQLCNVAQVIISEVFGSAPGTSTPAIQLAEAPNEVRALISDGIFYGTLGVLTSVATLHPELDFAIIYSGYADDWSPEAIHVLGESLLPHAQLVAKQVSVQWVMDARRANVAEGANQEDVAQTVDGVEPGSKADVAPPPTERMLPSRGTSSPYPHRSSR